MLDPITGLLERRCPLEAASLPFPIICIFMLRRFPKENTCRHCGLHHTCSIKDLLPCSCNISRLTSYIEVGDVPDASIDDSSRCFIVVRTAISRGIASTSTHTLHRCIYAPMVALAGVRRRPSLKCTNQRLQPPRAKAIISPYTNTLRRLGPRHQQQQSPYWNNGTVLASICTAPSRPFTHSSSSA